MKIRFGEFELDEPRYVLERSGERVLLRPKVFDLLAFLVCNRARVVLREELVERLWESTSVCDGSLSGLVNELRQALGEQGRGPSSIRTVHARGYQFVARVEGGVALARDVARSRAASLIERVSERGTCGVIIETGLARGRGGVAPGVPLNGSLNELAELASCAERNGFETHRLYPPDESLASPSRFARQVIDSMIAARGRAAVLAALPLPARVWLESSGLQAVAGGVVEAAGGPSDPLGSIALLLSRLSRRRPIVCFLEDVGRAGRRFARDLVTLVGRLDRDPVLWVATTRAFSAGHSWLRVLEAEGGFDRWVVAPVRAAALERSLRRLGLEPLPTVVMDAIDAHVRGAPVALEAVAEWIRELAGFSDPNDLAASEPQDREREPDGDEDVCRPPNPARSPMRKVTSMGVESRLRASDS